MSRIPHDFPDRLMACESATPAYREKYQKELQAMLEKRLGGIQRASYLLMTIVVAALAVIFGSCAVIGATSDDLPIWGTIIFAAGAVFGLLFAALGGWIAVTGRIRLKTQAPAIAHLAWGVCVLTVTVSLLAAPDLPDPAVGNRMVLFSLAFLVMAAVFLLGSRTEQAELRTKEKLLEIEYRLAELAESLGQDKELGQE